MTARLTRDDLDDGWIAESVDRPGCVSEGASMGAALVNLADAIDEAHGQVDDLPPLLLDGPAIAHELGIKPQTIRFWAHDGQITRRGHDERGRTVYDFDEVKARATRGRRRSRSAGVT